MQMFFSNPLFIISGFTGLVFAISGIVSLKYPPKGINQLYGYRTKSSMKNIDRWNFAQKYSSIEAIKLGSILALSGLIGLFFNPAPIWAIIFSLVSLLLLVTLLFMRVERAIKKKFD